MNYIQQLKDCKIKITPHKIAILELFVQHKHISAMEIVNTLAKQSIEISLATVYRILSSFEEHKLISKHNFGNEQAIYELNNSLEHHDHLICTSCSKVIEFSNQQIEDLQISIAQLNNFQLLSHTLNIYGVCENCSKVKSSPNAIT